MCDTFKVNTLRIFPVYVIVNGQLNEEFSLIKHGILKSELSKSELKLNDCQIYSSE